MNYLTFLLSILSILNVTHDTWHRALSFLTEILIITSLVILPTTVIAIFLTTCQSLNLLTSGMRPRLCFIYFLVLSISEERVINETEDIAGERHDDFERNDSNVTLTVIVPNLDESLPSAEPLVGTYPHDFSMTLPSVSRRSFKQQSESGYSYEQQGSLSKVSQGFLITLVCRNGWRSRVWRRQ